MIAFDREGWILAGFVVLFVTAVVVSLCGWVLLWRTRGGRPLETKSVTPPALEPEGPPPAPEEPATEVEPPPEEAEPVLPPGNPLR